MNRDDMLERVLSRREPWDVIVIGGGATGVGCALDAACRGFSVLLLEQSDFGKGTSSRSTKLVHGGVRYLEQGNVALVMGALRERGILLRNAPHIVRNLAFVVPTYEWWESPVYGLGLRLYDILGTYYAYRRSQRLSREEALERLPTIKQAGLRGGILYYDGQFDDARLLIALAQTAVDHGATLLNYAPVVALIKNSNGLIHGVEARDLESGNAFHAQARIVINATGVFSDLVRRMSDSNVAPILAPSQGIHLVFDRSFLPSESAILVPHAVDGRVLFAIPWAGHTLVGTTDTPVSEPTLEPRASEEEIDFILLMASLYLHRAPTRKDILSVFAGIRPLVRGADSEDTALLSRDHTIHVESSGLMNIAGGKWTTYRQMAEDCINKAIKQAGLRAQICGTREIRIHGFHNNSSRFGDLAGYGSDAEAIQKIIDDNRESGKPLDSRLPYREAEVLWAVRNEMARTVEDVLARRTRALFLNARAASDMAPRTAEIMAREMQRSPEWRERQISEFQQLAKGYLVD